jgi:hypothetical protein
MTIPDQRPLAFLLTVENLKKPTTFGLARHAGRLTTIKEDDIVRGVVWRKARLTREWSRGVTRTT